MTSHPIVAHQHGSSQRRSASRASALPLDRSVTQLPRFVRRSALAVRTYRLLNPIDWAALPERNVRLAPSGSNHLIGSAFSDPIRIQSGLVEPSIMHCTTGTSGAM